MSTLTDNSKRYGLISQVLHWGGSADHRRVCHRRSLGCRCGRRQSGRHVLARFAERFGGGFFVIRAGWWGSQTSPDELNQNKLMVLAHKLTVLALYVLPVVLTVTGILSILAAGQAVEFFGLDFFAGWTVVDTQLSELMQATHVILAHAVITVFALHTLAALWRQFVKRDGILTRMLPMSLGKS